MKKLLVFSILFIAYQLDAQNVGIGTTSPTHSLHIVPSTPTDPIRIQGLTAYGTENALLIVDPSIGIIKYIAIDSIIAIVGDSINTTGTDNQNIDSLTLNGTILTAYIENGTSANVDLSSLLSVVSDNQNIDSLTLNGTNLTVYIENGTSGSINLASLQDGTGTDDQNLTSATLVGTTLQINIENGSSASVNLAALQDGTGTDDQHIDSLRLNGTILTTYIENGTSGSINLQPIIDSALANIPPSSDTDWNINANGTGLEGYPGNNIAAGDNSIAAGLSNTASGTYSVAFGISNIASGDFSVVAGGDNSNATGNISVVGGGQLNDATGVSSTIAGGFRNDATGITSTVGGGQDNIASGFGATVSGGINNTASGFRSTISGGDGNLALSYGEWVGGLFSSSYVPNSTTVWNANDRIFSVGNGTSTISRSNALTLYKNGRLEINESYSLPNSDGLANEVLITDGSGNVSWQDPTSLPSLTSGEYTPMATQIGISLDSVRTEVSQFIRVGNYVHVTGTIWAYWNSDGNGLIYIPIPIASDFTSSRDLNGSVNRMSTGPYGNFTDSHNLHADFSGDRILLEVQNAYGNSMRGYQYSLIYKVQ